MLSVPLLIASVPPIVSEADEPSSLRVALASERVSELATSAVSTVMVVVADPLIVAVSEAVGGPLAGVQSLAKFQSPLTPFQVYEVIFSSPFGRQTRLDRARERRASRVFDGRGSPG
jgi:hypothetical protein